MMHKVNFQNTNKYTEAFIQKIGKPICLTSHIGNNLQNEFFWRNARCNNANTEGWEQMILIKTDDDKIIIQSRWNNRNLQVQKSGQCRFANTNQDLWEKFDVEVDEDGKVYFISCHTGNVMQCNNERFAWCSNQNRLSFEAWTIIEPKTENMMNSSDLCVMSLAITGTVVPCILGLVASALVPVAMASFGTVVAGVGTIHAPLVAGGFAALLQASSSALLTVNAAAIGAVAGTATGTVVTRLKKLYI